MEYTHTFHLIFLILNLQIRVPSWVPGRYRKSSWDSVL